MKGAYFMKKWTMLMMSVLLLGACSTDNGDSEKEAEANPSENETVVDADKETEKEDTNEDKDKNKIYTIGESAVITSDLYDFDYEVTVTDFEMTDEVDGESIYDYVRGLGEEDLTRFAVVYVTIKNISDEAYIPNEMFSANLSDVDQGAGTVAELEFSPELDEELAPGEEVSSKVVYTYDVNEENAYWFKYEIMSDEETIFEVSDSAK